MSGFTAEWLNLREPVDVVSRDQHLVETLRGRLASDKTLRILDLGAGTGANLRYLAPRLGGEQHWRLLDNDAALLSLVPLKLQAWTREQHLTMDIHKREMFIGGENFDCHVQWQEIDMFTNLRDIEFDGTDLVSASALLDLVSCQWLSELGGYTRKAQAAVYFALTYNGYIDFYPRCAADERVRELVNVHQLTDKGFGPALGPAAALRARDIFQKMDFDLALARSDWVIGGNEIELCRQLCDGWIQAARQVSPQENSDLSLWHESRLELFKHDDVAINVGHTDMVGWPAGRV